MSSFSFFFPLNCVTFPCEPCYLLCFLFFSFLFSYPTLSTSANIGISTTTTAILTACSRTTRKIRTTTDSIGFKDILDQ